MDPWTIELLLVREQPAARRGLARDCERGLLIRVRPGVYVEREAFLTFGPEGRAVVLMRALAAVSDDPPVFSHWSAAVLLGLPTLRTDVDHVHVLIERAEDRGLRGVAAHVAPTGQDVVFIGGLHCTAPARTVVDVARAAGFEEGVVIADGALHQGIPRDLLEIAAADAAGLRGGVQAQAAVAFARPEAESAAESRSRTTLMRLGVDPPVLQWEVWDPFGLAGRADFGFPDLRVAGEVDGEKKYRQAALAKHGAASAVIDEKRREDRMRRQLRSLARWGWLECGSTNLLGPILAASGVVRRRPRATIADYSTPFATAVL